MSPRTSYIAPFSHLCMHVFLCVCLATTAYAQGTNDLQARYQQDLADCETHQATQDLAACKLEARNALADAKRGLLNDSPTTTYEKNQLKRCYALKGEDREACIARIRGEGRSTGDVESGGILREIVRPVPSR